MAKLRLEGKVPNATPSNSMTIPPLSPAILWRPNNYRLGVNFKGVPKGVLGVKARHTGLVFWRRGNITVQLGRDKIVGIWNQGRDRQTYHISRDSFKEVQLRVDEVKEEIRNKIIEVVGDFMLREGLVCNGGFFWVRHEDWIKGEDYIDRLPRDLVIHDSVFKKVYGEGVEFQQGLGVEGGVEVKQFFKNRALQDFSPQIADALNAIAEQQRRLGEEALKPLTEQIVLHLKVQRETLKTLKKMQKVMGQRSLRDYG